MEIEKFLSNFGLSDTEGKIYLGLLETGPTTVLRLAKHLGIKRTTVHVNIETLIEKGFVAQTKKGSRRKVLADDPQKFQYILSQRKGEIEKMEDSLPTIISKLTAKSNHAGKRYQIDVKYYEGKEGVQKVYQDVFKAKEIRSYVNLGEAHKVFPKNPSLYVESQRGKVKSKVREIIDDSEASIAKAEEFAQKTNFDFRTTSFPLDLSAINILLYDGKVAMINFKPDIKASVLENKAYYDIQVSIFDFLWKMLSKSK